MSKKKILVNGCGMTFGSESIRGWPKILSLLGETVVDRSAPAVSNQWIVDRTAEYLLSNSDVDRVILQLTNIDKLDVEINTDARQLELVQADSLRNFTWQGVWPSSKSREHASKQLYYDYLYSPTLLTKELAVKLSLLASWCRSKGVELQVYQGYTIPWTQSDLELVAGIVKNIPVPWHQQYEQSAEYQRHDSANHNTVPCVEFAFVLAQQIARDLRLDSEKIQTIAQLHAQKHRHATDTTVNMV